MHAPTHTTDSAAFTIRSSRWRTLAAGVALGCALMTSAQPCFAGDGDLDLTFGTGGVFQYDFPMLNYEASPAGAVVQSDGKIVMAGMTSGTPNGIVVVRFNVNGSVDLAFGGGDGYVIVAGVAGYALTYPYLSLGVQSNGGIIVGNTATTTTTADFAAFRLDSNGVLDTSFGTYGLARFDSPAPEYARSITVDSADRVVMAGHRNLASSDSDFLIVRFTATGLLDTSFGGGGETVARFGNLLDTPADIAICLDGAIVVAGEAREASNVINIGVAKLDSSGLLDSTFDGDGMRVVSTTTGSEIGRCVAVDTTGRIVIGDSRNELVRLLPSGLNDPSFSGDGIALGSGMIPADVAVRPTGQIVVAGPAPSGMVLVGQFTDAGVSDGSFAPSGRRDVQLPTTSFPSVASLALDTSGRTLVGFAAGFPSAIPNVSGIEADIGVVAVTASGAVDTAFGLGGYCRADVIVTSSIDIGTGVAAAACGDKIIMVGYSRPLYNTQCIAVVRLLNDGSLDPSFGDGGTMYISLGSQSLVPADVAVQPTTGKVVIGGYGYWSSPGIGGYAMFVLRLNDDGSLDDSFGGGDGFTSTGFAPSNSSQSAGAMEALPNGDIILGGTRVTNATLGHSYNPSAARFSADGTLMYSTFGPSLGWNNSGAVQAVTVQSSGKVVVAGYAAASSTGYDFMMCRFNVDGSADTSFGSGGLVLTPLGSGSATDLASAILCLPDDRLLAVGRTGNFVGMARYEADGALDGTFDGDGKLISVIDSLSYGFGEAAMLLPGGKFFVAGRSYPDSLLVARFNPDGSLDTTFSGNGWATHLPNSQLVLNDIAGYCDNHVLLAGSSFGGANYDYFLARIENRVNTPPVAVAAGYAASENGPGEAEITVECTGPAGRLVTLNGSASHDDDAGDSIVSYRWDVSNLDVILDNPSSAVSSGMFPLGVTMATLTVTDSRGGVDSADVIVTVQDTMPPSVMCTTSAAMLWPPKHDMRTVQVIVVATDACSVPEAVIPITVTVRSSEADDATGNGDGNTTGDVNGGNGFAAPVNITSAFAFDASCGEDGAWIATINLRAERAGSGQGRAYTIDVLATDPANNTGTTSCVIVVPKGMGSF